MPKIVPVNYKKLVQVFEKEGFQVSRTNLTTAGISRERYFELLEEVK